MGRWWRGGGGLLVGEDDFIVRGGKANWRGWGCVGVEVNGGGGVVEG